MGRSQNWYEYFGEEKSVLIPLKIEVRFIVLQGGNNPLLAREYQISTRRNRDEEIPNIHPEEP
jgi:hypothetical protein